MCSSRLTNMCTELKKIFIFDHQREREREGVCVDDEEWVDQNNNNAISRRENFFGKIHFSPISYHWMATYWYLSWTIRRCLHLSALWLFVNKHKTMILRRKQFFCLAKFLSYLLTYLSLIRCGKFCADLTRRRLQGWDFENNGLITWHVDLTHIQLA